jgi:hypothetical protein
VDPAHALWIGGPQGSGKSSIAWAISRRFDLQLYVVDHRTWVHEPRMPHTEFAGLSMDERWLDASPQQMLGWFVNHSRHRFRLVLEDIRSLPGSPPVLVEGPQLFPTFVSAVTADPAQALFLIPFVEDQRERLLARGGLPGTSDPERARANATDRDLLILSRLAREAEELRLPVLPVDRPLDEMIELAVAHFAPAIAECPGDADLPAIRRFENDVLAEQVRLYRESLGDEADDVTLAFACECGAPGCAEVVDLSLGDYKALSVAVDRSPLRAPRS